MQLPDWYWCLNEATIFFGMYHWFDYLRYRMHWGKKAIFWCGADILNIRPSWRFPNTIHYCENTVEYEALRWRGIHADIRPSLFDIPEAITHFTPTDHPHVYMNAHPGREVEYGVPMVKILASALPHITFHVYGISGDSTANLIYHGNVAPEAFKREIEGYQAALRLNEFDGFSEILARSALMGQYQYSIIPYPHMEPISGLWTLDQKLTPNYDGQRYWLTELSKPL